MEKLLTHKGVLMSLIWSHIIWTHFIWTECAVILCSRSTVKQPNLPCLWTVTIQMKWGWLRWGQVRWS